MALHNTLPILDSGILQKEQFSSIQVGIKLQNLHVFVAPVFALSSELGSGSDLPKWRCSPRCLLGIHLGPSAEHAQNVYLVLNPTTGLVSPQYHCQFDDFFESVRFQGPEMTVPTTWRSLSKLTQANSMPLRELQEITTAKTPNTPNVDSPQGEANIFEHATDNVVHT